MKTEQSQALVDHESDQLKKLRNRFHNVLNSHKLKNLGFEIEADADTEEAEQEHIDAAGV